MKIRCGITGRGYALPQTKRSNDDPVFSWLRSNDPSSLNHYFTGYMTRHVLGPDENVVDLMVSASEDAMQMACLRSRDVDLLLGFASVSRYIMPNELAEVHQRLGLGQHCWVVPINSEYSNFNASVVFADAVVHSGRARNALIVCGGNWSQYVNYHTSASVSAGDGAGAAVMQPTSDASTFRVVDIETITNTRNTWGHMMMAADYIGTAPTLSLPVQGGALNDPGVFTQPYFHLDSDGIKEFTSFGVCAPIDATRQLLLRNVLHSEEVTIICHQTSRYLMDRWSQELAPHKLVDTLSTFANMTLATIPVNLAFAYDQIETDYLVLLGIGPELHSNALLMRRYG
jgi:3-oxoacyl-[acyl-carrier-protein] synthase-3